ncbi:DUF4249 domain-containing protein [uncultured Aquimarina sp.]|uniref:DUF4249 domain-containing protein n=1 Tax=uncultured Aquimarina sp. TaxID=575652 RepID=UPI00262301DD|nr:DUF4249 domain-containing protein [uncultured Aquimarina sp.]
MNINLRNYNSPLKALFFMIGFITLFGCTEPFDIENDRIEDFLVINATVTDQVSNQRIVLSRTFGFEESEPIPEEGASIVIIENNLTEYPFNENSPGEYYSVQEFGVTAGNEYKLTVRTANGRSYSSQKVIAPQPTSIDRVYAKRMVNDQGTDGIGVFLDTFDPTGNSLYYRYGFEETSKFTAPNWISTDITSSAQGSDVTFAYVERPESERVCYISGRSNSINIANTSSLTEDRIQDLSINFIPVDDIRVSERYSILVKQYVQTREAQSFYRVLNDFSGSESLFSQIQPGFIRGNIVSETDTDENVLGYFDVSSLAEERIFFNRSEFISEIPFVLDCEPFTPEPDLEVPNAYQRFLQSLIGLIRGNTVRLLNPTPLPPPPPPEVFPVFTFVPRICGDCTAVGKSEVPEFWID